jgi:CHAT domain-containing protein/tetratricopeptide (TPR) repeat protein
VALSCYQEALAVFRELGAIRHQARVLNNLGGIHDLLGEPDAALEHYGQALALRRQIGDREGEAQTLINIAVIHLTAGEWQEALRLFGQAREIPGGLRDRSLEASLLNNIGYTYNSLGEPQRALVFLEQALALRRAIGDLRGEVITRNNLGLAWRNLGDLEEALESHRLALELAVALGDARQEAVTRQRLGEALLERGDSAAALQEIAQALPPFQRAGLRRGEVEILELRGRALAQAERPREALALFEDVLVRRRALHDRPGEAGTLVALAAAEQSLRLHDAASLHAEAAVARVEELRNGFASPDLRASFLATRRRAFALLIDLLMDRHAAAPRGGHDRAALEVSEKARARGLTDALQRAAGRSASTVPVRLLDRRRSLRLRLSAKADKLIQLSERPDDPKAVAREREIESLQAELDGIEAEIRRQDPSYATFSDPRPIAVDEITRLLEPGTLLLEYSLGERRSFLWAIGPGSFRSFVLPSRREIEALARQVYEEMSTVEAGSERRGRAAEALGRILLEPVWKEGEGLRRLVVVPDAALHIVPFGALPAPDPGTSWDAAAPRKPLLESLEVVAIPSATTLALQRQRLEQRIAAMQWAAVLADPVFSAEDPRLAGPADRRASAPVVPPFPVFERLPASRREAEAIAALAPKGQVWTALGFAASREAVLSGQLRSYRVVHFATHGLADARNPELSGLVLSLVDAAGRPQEGFLGLTDIYELDLGADLVVLSGCRTALGKEVGGEGLMGLTRAFLYAGVPRVVGGLWRVEDRTTAELMSHFYQALWRDGLSPAAALRQAQRSLRRDPRYRHPHSWAGFLLQGDWR